MSQQPLPPLKRVTPEQLKAAQEQPHTYRMRNNSHEKGPESQAHYNMRQKLKEQDKLKFMPSYQIDEMNVPKGMRVDHEIFQYITDTHIFKIPVDVMYGTQKGKAKKMKKLQAEIALYLTKLPVNDVAQRFEISENPDYVKPVKPGAETEIVLQDGQEVEIKDLKVEIPKLLDYDKSTGEIK